MKNTEIDHLLAEIEADAAPEVGRAFVRLVADYFARAAAAEGPVSPPLSEAEGERRFDEPLPVGGRPIEEVLRRLERDVVAGTNRLVHPMYVGHQVSAPLPAAVWADALVSALNQSLAVREMSPVLTFVEERVVGWLTGQVGWGAGAGGTLTSGGTEANFTALLAARNAAIPDAWAAGVGPDAGVILCGEHAHYAIVRAAGQLGLGTRNAVAVPSRGFRMDVDALAARLEALRAEGRRVVAVVATAGSTATGSFDDLDAVADLCERHGVWMHVDGAHGASALLSERHRWRLAGVGRADSVAWDPHKMMLLPLSAGMVLVRDERALERAFAQQAPYLFHGGEGRIRDQGIRSFQCSRRADVLKLWVALQRYGSGGIGRLYDHLCDTARAFHASIAERDDFTALHEPESNILCFRYTPPGVKDADALDALNWAVRDGWNRSGEGWITTTLLGGRRVLRVTVMNPRTRREHVEATLDGLARIGREVTAARG